MNESSTLFIGLDAYGHSDVSDWSEDSIFRSKSLRINMSSHHCCRDCRRSCCAFNAKIISPGVSFDKKYFSATCHCRLKRQWTS